MSLDLDAARAHFKSQPHHDGTCLVEKALLDEVERLRTIGRGIETLLDASSVDLTNLRNFVHAQAAVVAIARTFWNASPWAPRSLGEALAVVDALDAQPDEAVPLQFSVTHWDTFDEPGEDTSELGVFPSIKEAEAFVQGEYGPNGRSGQRLKSSGADRVEIRMNGALVRRYSVG